MGGEMNQRQHEHEDWMQAAKRLAEELIYQRVQVRQHVGYVLVQADGAVVLQEGNHLLIGPASLLFPEQLAAVRKYHRELLAWSAHLARLSEAAERPVADRFVSGN
jgi:hypothetical protein